MGHKQKRNRRIPPTGKQLPFYNQILSRLKYQKQRLHSWTRKVQRCQIQQRFYLDVRTHFKPTETFQCTNLYSCHPPGATKGFIKGEARSFSTRLKNIDYPATTVEKHLSEVNFADRKKALEQRNKNASKKILPFVTQYHPAHRQPKRTMCGFRLQRSFGRNILELLVYYLMLNKRKNLKDIKSSCLSICTSSL